MINNNDNNALISREELLAALDSGQQLRQSNYDEALARGNESDVATCRAEAQRIAEIKVVRNIIAALPTTPLDPLNLDATEDLIDRLIALAAPVTSTREYEAAYDAGVADAMGTVEVWRDEIEKLRGALPVLETPPACPSETLHQHRKQVGNWTFCAECGARL